MLVFSFKHRANTQARQTSRRRGAAANRDYPGFQLARSRSRRDSGGGLGAAPALRQRVNSATQGTSRLVLEKTRLPVRFFDKGTQTSKQRSVAVLNQRWKLERCQDPCVNIDRGKLPQPKLKLAAFSYKCLGYLDVFSCNAKQETVRARSTPHREQRRRSLLTRTNRYVTSCCPPRYVLWVL